MGIDLETGRLRKYGSYYYEYHHDTNHPVSGVKYEGYQIPCWNEITRMVVDLHQYFRGFLVLGWDIALTENGPVVVEINSSPCSKMAQMANGGLKEKWECLKAENNKAVGVVVWREIWRGCRWWRYRCLCFDGGRGSD